LGHGSLALRNFYFALLCFGLATTTQWGHDFAQILVK